MDGYRELQVLLLALRERVVDPARLAVAAGEWDHRSDPDFMQFLAGRGVISPVDLQRLDSVTTDLPIHDPGTNVPVRPAVASEPDGDATSDLRGGHTPAGPDRLPTTSSRYRVLRLHQTGGLGRVWLARDTAVGRDVALKTLRPDRATHPTVQARFVREARVTGQLEHPSIVPLYDLSAGGAEPFYVMRFVAGRTLAGATTDYHRRRGDGQAGPLDLTALLDAFVSVCRAVAFAHSRNVLHRDLKGENIVVGEFGEVFLLDWGLAKSVGEADDPAGSTAVGNGDGELTATGAAVGTPAYMAPEVAVGGAATKAADVYGLGAILYAMLTGRPPYTGSSAVDVLAKVTSAEPKPVRATNPSAPPALEAVCRKAMARNPADRYPSAEAVATEVRRWLADEPVTAYRERWPARAVRWARRRKTAVVAASVLLLTLTVASSVAAGLVWREQQKTRLAWEQAQAEKVNATENADAAIETVRELSNFVRATELAGGVRTNQSDEDRKKGLDASLTAYKRLLALHPDDPNVQLNVARLYRFRANLARLLNETADATAAYWESTRYYDALIEAHPTVAAYREDSILVARDSSGLLLKLGRLKDGLQVLEDATAEYEQLQRPRPNDPSLQRLLASLVSDRSDLESLLGRFADSERSARKSVDLYAAVAESGEANAVVLDSVLSGAAQTRLALTQREQGKLDESLRNHDEAVERLAKLSPTRDSLHFLHRARTERAWTWSRVPDRRERAIADLDAAILGWEKLAKEYPQAAFYVHWQAVAGMHRGRLHALVGRRDKAVQDLTAATKLLEGLVARYKDIPAYGYDLGRVYAAQGEVAADPREAAEWDAKARGRLEPAAKQNPEYFPYRKALADLDARTKGPKP